MSEEINCPCDLIKWRASLRASQMDLYHITGVSRHIISEFENNRRALTPEESAKIVEGLKKLEVVKSQYNSALKNLGGENGNA